MEFVGILLLFAPLGALIYYVRRTSPPGPSLLSILGIVVEPPQPAPAVAVGEPAPPEETGAQAKFAAEEPTDAAPEDAAPEDAAPKRMSV